jgi:toxin-antitoxin system PIN domain toxin
MTAVDTNILVYSHRAEMPLHEAARNCLERLAESPSAWAIPWPCVHEFLAVVSNPRIFRTPTPMAKAIEQVDAWLESPSLVLLGETKTHWATLTETLLSASVAGGAVHDGRIPTLCREHSVTAFYSVDRDFSRFGGLRTVNPLVG